MTGLPTLLVELDDGTGTFPHDITAFVRLQDSWEINRGRGNEFGDVQPGRLTISLDNRDGRFTIGNPTYDVEINQPIRLTETVGATTSARHTGCVEDWPQRWTSALANVAVSGITSLDRFEPLARRDMPGSLLQGEILLDVPVAYYTLGEPAGATSAGDTSGHGHQPLTEAGTGTAVAFGSPSIVQYDELTAAAFAGGKYLSVAPLVTPAATEYSVEVFFSTTATSVTLFFAGMVVQVAVTLDGSGHLAHGSFTSAAAYNDGAPHHLVLTYAGGVSTLYVDGASIGSHGSVVDGGGGTLTLSVGSYVAGATYTGTLAHVAAYSSALTAGRVTAHANAGRLGASTDSSDERVARLAAYAKIPTGEQDLEPGALAATAPQAGGGKFLPAMQAVAKAEGGVLFVAGDGALTFQSRTHRFYAATGTPALALTADQADHDDLTIGGAKEYLVNTVTGSRDNGAVQRVVDEASVLEHNEYPEDLSGLLVLTDTEVLDAITWRKAAYSTPKPRLSTVTIDLFTSSAALQEAVLALELGDRITLTGMPTQAPWAVADLLIEGMRERQSLSEWKVTFNTVPAEHFHAWCLDHPTFGALDTPANRLLF